MEGRGVVVRKLIVSLCVAMALSCFVASAEAAAWRRVKVLWLGDNGHHQPLARARQIHSVLSHRGIDVEYTDDLAMIEARTLARYDVLLLYANIERIGKEQEKAILDAVAAGKGFVPVHCGSYCFLNSPELTALTGGRFKSHGTGVFKETHAADQKGHPAIAGLKEIESWDETYVHEMHNEKDRAVLSHRVDAKGREPYTWVRQHGKGRVFYTAWGHDERTWGNADFQALLERGIRWAAGDWALRVEEATKPFAFMEAVGGLPNYLPGKAWGTAGELIREMQKPLTPEESIKRMVVPPGFEVKLVAAEPKIKKPICMAFDERGRMWIAETVDYPNEMQKEGEGRDRIVICEDADGDGVAEKFTVFGEKLSIPTSLVFASGGVIVAQAPHMLFLKDTNGDDVADERKVLFTGFGTGDTHAGPSNLRWGFDNWIYGAIGYSGFRGTVGGERISFGQGLFRFKADGSKVEFLASSNNNTWGLGLSEDGHVLASTANRNPSFYLHIPNRYYEQVRGFAAGRLETIADTERFWALTDKVRQMDHHGNYTAGAGHALYTARSFPKEYWNRAAFVTEPTGHIVGKFVIERVGSGFKARNDFNILSSDDEWTSPIMAEVGPDGALWVIDWYNYIIQHNPIPRGFEKGKGNAYETPLRDKTHGRIYRLVYPAAKASPILDLSKADASVLVSALKSDNQLWRMHAQRLLVERQDQSAVAELVKLVGDKSADEIALNAPAIHALWALHGLGAVDGPQGRAVVKEAMRHPSPGVRKAAVDVIPRDEKGVEAIVEAKVLEDGDAQVRKSALLALSEMPASQAAGAAVFAALSRKENGEDRGITDAATIAAARHDAGFLAAAFAAFRTSGERVSVATPTNLLPNPSFEQGSGEMPTSWRVRTYGGQAKHQWADVGRTGGRSLRIESSGGSDTSFFIDVPVEPQTEYRLSGWVKTESVTGAMGGLFNVHGTEARTPAVNGTSDWKKVEIIFNSQARDRVSINALFGGWGRSRGVAWFDDVELMRSSSVSLPGAVGKAVSVVAGHYAQRGPVESIFATMKSLKGADPVLAAAVIEGLAQGWPANVKPEIGEAEAAVLRDAMKALSEGGTDRLIVLVEKWGKPDLFAAELKALTEGLKKIISDAAAADAARIEAARKLVGTEDSAASVDAVIKQITPKASPELQVGLLDALSRSRGGKTGEVIVGRWNRFTPSAQRAALGMLLRRPAWTGALLDAIEGGSVNAKDLAAEHWQALKGSPDRRVAARAQKLETASGRTPSPDKKKLIDSLLAVTSKGGDVNKGREVFAKNCQVCHALEGQGGQVGPDLTGVGARPKGDILVEILDPNRSVEGTFRLWIVETKANDLITGRLLAESRTSVEIIDATNAKHVIDRKDINNLRASELSVMPEGFEQITPEELGALLEFLSASKVKH